VTDAKAAQLRAVIRFLGPGEMTPSAARALEQIADSWEVKEAE